MQSPDNAVPATAIDLHLCSSCGEKKPGAEFSSTSDDCLACEERARTHRDHWAAERAAGRAAFVRYDSGNGIPYSRGNAVMHCINCDTLHVGEKAISRHAKQCRSRRK